MAEKKFELTDLANGKKSTAEVKSGTLGPDVLNIANLAQDHGMFTFDPGFMATAACESKITFIDGDEGVLLHRGIPIEQLAEKSNFLEVAYLLINGELPTSEQLVGVHARDPVPHDDQRIAAAILQRLSVQRASDGDAVGRGRVDGGVLSRLDGHP